MFKLGKNKVYCGDFHTHWRVDPENPSLFLALLNYWDVDFVVLQAAGFEEQCQAVERFSKKFDCNIRFFKGAELQYDWAHLALWRNSSAIRIAHHKSPIDELKALRATARLIVFAHPGPEDLDLIKSCYRQGLIDAIQWPKGGIKTDNWYRQCEAEGIHIPVVGGMDIHYLNAIYQEERIFYQGNTTPAEHVMGETILTLVTAENCTEEHLVSAVKSGCSVDINMQTLAMHGPAALVDSIQRSDVLKTIMERRKQRQPIVLKALNNTHTKLKLYAPHRFFPFQICADSQERIRKIKLNSKETVINLPYPLLRSGQRDHQMVCARSQGGLRKIFAISGSWPLRVHFTPRVLREAPRGKPRGNLLRPDALRGRDYACRVPGRARAGFVEPCEAKNAILSSITASATEAPPCGSLLRPEALRARDCEGREPQGFPWPTRVVSGRLAKKGRQQGYENCLEIGIANISQKELAGNIRLTGAFWKSAKHKKLLALHPGAVQKLIASVDRPASCCQEKPVAVDITLSDGARLNSRKEMAFAAALYVGQRSPWMKHDYTIRLNRADHVVAPWDHYRGAEDLSAEVTLSWDEKNFYVYAEVSDDIFCNRAKSLAAFGDSYPGSELFLNDSLELGIDPLNLKEDALGHVYNITAGLDNKGVPRICLFARPILKPGPLAMRDWRADSYLRRSRLAVERNEKRKITFYRLTMPWLDLYPLAPVNRSQFGFSILVNDNDGDGNGRKFIYWGGNVSDKKPSQWETVTFAE